MSFIIKRPCNAHSPDVSDTTLVGYYSIGNGFKYLPDMSEMKYYAPPHNPSNVNFDLNKDFDLTHRYENNLIDIKLNHLLTWISQNYHVIYKTPSDKSSKDWKAPDFVCYRGLLTKILCTLYEKREGWTICASKLDNVIYLCQFDTDEKLRQMAAATPFEKKLAAWGHKFEQFVLSDTPTTDPNTSVPMDEDRQFCCVFKSRFGNNTLLYGAEMDGIESKAIVTDILNDRGQFIELKTTPSAHLNLNGEILRRKRYKLLKWWGQCYFVGIKKITVGCRSDDGIVEELKDIAVESIPNMCRGIWNHHECKGFFNEFLQFVKTTVTKNCNECLYEFSYIPSQDRIQVKELCVTCKYTFLDEWYLTESKRYKNSLDS